MARRSQRFLLAAGPAAAAGFTVMSYDGNVANAAVLSILGGLLFGAFVEVFGMRRDRELAASGIPPGDHPVRPRLSVLVKGQTLVVIQDSVTRAMAQIGAKRLHEGSTRAEVSFETGWTRHGVGERIVVRYSERETGVDVMVTSEPKWSSTTVDFGRNFSHVYGILERLEQDFGASNVKAGEVEDAEADVEQ